MKEERIENLLKKQSSGTITPNELEELFTILNTSENDSGFEKFSKQKWEEAQKSEAPSVNTSNVWERIAQSTISKNPKKSIFPNSLFQVMKYAAIIIVTIGITWLFVHKHGNGGNVLVYNEFSVPYGSKSSLKLSDGTRIWLNSGSKIRYPHRFSSGNRIVYLEGEAFFDVAHNPKKIFIVKTSDINIKVFGTRFNVKSFAEEKDIETTLESGSVVIEKTDIKGRILKNVRMQPLQIVTYSKAKGNFAITLPEKTKADNKTVRVSSQGVTNFIEPIAIKSIEITTSWKDNLLLFKGENMESLKIKMERWYNVKIILKNENIKSCTFSGTFDTETVEQALDALKMTYPFSYKMDKNIITIY